MAHITAPPDPSSNAYPPPGYATAPPNSPRPPYYATAPPYSPLPPGYATAPPNSPRPPYYVTAPPAYLYLGHASDVCLQDNTLETIPIPEGSIVLQAGLCGIITRLNPALLSLFGNKNNKYLLENPLTTLNTINDYLTHNRENPLSLHKYGDTIINSTIVSLAYFPTINKFKLSGVIKMSEIDFDDIEIVHNFKTDGNLPISKFIDLFKYSMFPTIFDVHLDLALRGLSESLSEEDIYMIQNDHPYRFNFADFIKTHPGIHYHKACRSTDPRCDAAVAARRAESSAGPNRANRNLSILLDSILLSREYIESSFKNHMSTVTQDELYTIFRKMLDKPDKYYTRGKSVAYNGGVQFTDIGNCENEANILFLMLDVIKARGNSFLFRDLLNEAYMRCNPEAPIDVDVMSKPIMAKINGLRLLIACKLGEANDAMRFISEGADVKYKDMSNLTPLYFAELNKLDDVVAAIKAKVGGRRRPRRTFYKKRNKKARKTYRILHKS